MKRIGILAGTFDPIHKGHISFALQAIESAGLSEVVLLPEPKPRHKHDVTHVSHRIAMIKRAIKPYPKIKLLEIPDKQFTVATSLPRLNQSYPNQQLLLLIGTDVLSHITVWPHIRQLLKTVGLVVAVRGEKDERHAHQLLSLLPVEPPESHVLVSNYKMASSRQIRTQLRKGQKPDGMLDAAMQYANEHWLYEFVAGSGSANKS